MARRLFNTEIVNSDVFLDMPLSTQALYFHLGMHADDDGFVYPKKVMRLLGSTDDDLKILLAKKFLLVFESGVMVVKHWKVNNYIRSDRYHATTHVQEKALLSLDSGSVYHMTTVGIPSGSISKEVSKKVNREDFKNESGRELNAEETKRQFEKGRQLLGVQKKN